jgi:hypothetical protein
MEGQSVNFLREIWREAAVAHFKVLTHCSSVGIEENHENPSHEHQAGIVPTQLKCLVSSLTIQWHSTIAYMYFTLVTL